MKESLERTFQLKFADSLSLNFDRKGHDCRPPNNRLLAYLVGWGILSVAGLIPVINVIVLIAATVYGLGMIVVALFRARSGPREPAPTDTSQPAPSPAS